MQPKARASQGGAMTTYENRLSMFDARQRYFADNGFDGTYSERWVRLKAGPIRLVFPNAAGRVRAVKLHDLHHIVTGYQTTWTGEAEIGAWEIAGGCGRFAWAWLLNLYAFAIGAVIVPRAVWRAFVRGRHTRNLYRGDAGPHAAVLDRSVGEMRQRLGLDQPAARPRSADAIAFVAWVAASAVLSLAPLAATASVLWLAVARH
jgi:hypothetical protein